LLDLSARAVNETVTASSVFSQLFTRHVPRLRPGRRRITTTTRPQCSVQLLKKDILANYLDHVLPHGRIITDDPYPLLSASVTIDYLYELIHDRLITIDHYRLSSFSVKYCHQSKASFPRPSSALGANHTLTPSNEVPPSGRSMSYYMLGVSSQNLVSMALREGVDEISKNLGATFTFQWPGG
jgi:hypothetical protein